MKFHWSGEVMECWGGGGKNRGLQSGILSTVINSTEQDGTGAPR
jgi:hypothetical protein